MRSPAAPLKVDRPPRRGIRFIVGGRMQHLDCYVREPDADGRAIEFPRRPDFRVLSKSIPLFFIARNENGLWVAREAEGRTGGIFLFKRSALRFARKNSAPAGCATMFLTQRFELDVENQGGVLAAWLDWGLRRVAKLIPDHPPPIPIRRGVFTGEYP